MRSLIKNFRVRYKQAVNEIRDLNEEHAKDRGEYFESVQAFEREVGIYKAILKMIINPRELQRLEQKCTYDGESKKWTVPLFTVGQSKQINFPKLRLMSKKHGGFEDTSATTGFGGEQSRQNETWRELSLGRKSLADFASMSFRQDTPKLFQGYATNENGWS